MVTRNLSLTALAATVFVGLLAGPVAAAEAHAVPTVAMQSSIDAPSFRAEIESYVREVNERMRTTLSEDLRRELGKKMAIATNELRTRG